MQNLEAKFKPRNLEVAKEKAEALGYLLKGTHRQADTFFRVQHGRLKLREQDGSAELIYYARENSAGLQRSRYEIFPLAREQRETMREMLTGALGVLGTVKKERMLLERDNVRLHLDRVDGLGDFGEIEALVASDEEMVNCRDAIDELLSALEIRRANLISASYLEMLRPVN